MLTMDEQEKIRMLYEEEGKSLSEIARMTGLNYRTVRRYAYKEDWNAEESLRAENSPVLGNCAATIDRWLEDDRKVPRKQRHTARRIYDRLVEECGYRGSYSSVRRYVHRKKKLLGSVTEGFLPLDAPQGCAQADFGEFLYYDGAKKEKKGYALTVTFPYSNHAYTQVFPSQNQECLLEGLKRVFERIGGVPPRMRFDNLSPAVVEVLEGRERVLTEGFTRFKLHYRFQADFCNPGKGNEKGNVENKVGYSGETCSSPSRTSRTLSPSTPNCGRNATGTPGVSITGRSASSGSYGRRSGKNCSNCRTLLMKCSATCPRRSTNAASPRWTRTATASRPRFPGRSYRSKSDLTAWSSSTKESRSASMSAVTATTWRIWTGRSTFPYCPASPTRRKTRGFLNRCRRFGGSF